MQPINILRLVLFIQHTEYANWEDKSACLLTDLHFSRPKESEKYLPMRLSDRCRCRL